MLHTWNMQVYKPILSQLKKILWSHMQCLELLFSPLLSSNLSHSNNLMEATIKLSGTTGGNLTYLYSILSYYFQLRGLGLCPKVLLNFMFYHSRLSKQIALQRCKDLYFRTLHSLLFCLENHLVWWALFSLG